MKILKQLLIIFTIIGTTKFCAFGQANPFINVLLHCKQTTSSFFT